MYNTIMLKATFIDCRIPEIVFWHIPSQAYRKIAPSPGSPITQPCVGSINLEAVAPQAAEWGNYGYIDKQNFSKGMNLYIQTSQFHLSHT
jgi:hypothetical protein